MGAIEPSETIEPEGDGKKELIFASIDEAAQDFRDQLGDTDAQRQRQDDLEGPVGDAVNGAQVIQVVNKQDEEKAAEFLKKLTALEKSIKTEFAPMVDSANRAHKESTALRGRVLKPVQEAKSSIQKKMGDFRTREEKKLREIEKARIEEAKKQQEEEALRIAEQAEAEGKPEIAEEFIAEAVAATPTVVVPPKPVAPSKIAYRKTWFSEIVDADAFYKHLGENPALAHLAPINLGAINKIVSASEGAITIPGIKSDSKQTPYSTGR